MTDHRKETKLHHALITVILMAVFMLVCLVFFHTAVLIPLIFGCAAAGCVAVRLGYTWDEILKGMIDGIMPSIEAILILLMIGMLVGSWIACGTVPAIICYGLKLVTPAAFLPSCMFICLITAFVIGSWGTVGTMGIAFMGMGLALQLPAPAIAGAVISGAYMGEVISPLSDATNLTCAVIGDNVFSLVRRILPAALIAGVLTMVLYAVLGAHLSSSLDANAVARDLTALQDSITSQFHISLFTFIPLLIMIICLLAKLPAIPSMLAGSISGMIQAVLMQHIPVGKVLEYAVTGYVSTSGHEMADTLLTTGGIQSMLDTISIILIAMAFGGIMRCSKQMEALVRPILPRLNSGSGLTSVTVLTCILTNLILPDQYLGISMPGQMYGPEYRRKGFRARDLGAALLGGAAVTSPLIPWNSCGAYCTHILMISPAAYGPFAFYGLLLPVITILMSFGNAGRRSRESQNS